MNRVKERKKGEAVAVKNSDTYISNRFVFKFEKKMKEREEKSKSMKNFKRKQQEETSLLHLML